MRDHKAVTTLKCHLTSTMMLQPSQIEGVNQGNVEVLIRRVKNQDLFNVYVHKAL